MTADRRRAASGPSSRRRRRHPSGAAALAPPPAVRTPPPPPATLLAAPAEPVGRPPRCRHCLRSPALDVRPRVTVGVVLAHANEEAEGPFCRQCGMARARALTDRTLLLGWSAPLAPFANVRTLVRNYRVLRSLRELPDPPPGPVPRYAERPLDPGPPVFRRKGMFGIAAVAVVILTIFGFVAYVNEYGPVQFEGECVDLAPDGASLTITDSCGPPADGRIEEIVTGQRTCQRPTDEVVALPDYPNNSRACVRSLTGPAGP